MHTSRNRPPHSDSSTTAIATTQLRLRVTYAEVDRMGFLHHSNHLRWFERGREEFCRRRYAGYKELEDSGTLVVVVDASLHYRAPLQFEDVVDLTVRLTEIRQASLVFEYQMRRVSDGVIVATGRTRHAFVTREGRLMRPTPHVIELLSAEESIHRVGEIE